MTSRLILTAALLVLVAGPVMAQDRPSRRGDRPPQMQPVSAAKKAELREAVPEFLEINAAITELLKVLLA